MGASKRYPRVLAPTLAERTDPIALEAAVWKQPVYAGKNEPVPLNRHYLALFFAKVEVDASGCWVWRASRTNQHYGCFIGESAHRTAHRWFVGPIPSGWQVDHQCRNTWCVNPVHLEAVTCTTNHRRGHDATGTCRKGHPWVPENIRLVNGRKSRMCVICYRDLQRRKDAKRRAKVLSHANQ
jgi:hypothetical protein